ncbi:uncharacterized protein MYCFIDRAFT_35652 [Pseudocercospora fijiensis CIRAD86]|uniref:Major facilitator superfamily (MFS) profile domain-containing protein n=1 Tax=Pseudocercospora fijiensis (strain CIRAD86) TaxID=383855 RepID=M2ZNX1_PSEFD|nr:uncharacterized protein MYCFIDRAFT_35652 [Pseudocercospora fijiensis CIRAD86]EME80774.1 hypothetical protein MYCFIDRAFT_35652 [Pseudocercospora fijiensis CIRAD86]
MSRHSSISVENQAKAKHQEQWIELARQQNVDVDGIEPYAPNSEAEKRLLRKLDMRIIPCCWCLYLLGYLDRANIGNAKTGGLEKDFNLSSTQYSVVLLVFFVSYVIFEIPSNLILTRVRPSLYLPALAVGWGGIAASMAGCNNWHQLAGVRFALGVIESCFNIEAGFAPGIAFYLSCWYKRYELARRFSWYYTAVACAGIVSGLLAGLITKNLDGARGIAGWRWLFIIEGVGLEECVVGSYAVGTVVWFFMADYPSTTRWLTPEERMLAAQRMAYDGIGSTQGTEEQVKEWTAFKMTISDWKVWALALMYALLTGSQTMQYFIPTLVGVFGWKGWQGQYHSIPPYALALVCTLAFPWISDHYKNKPLFIMTFAGFDTIMFIILAATRNHIVRYVFTVFAFGPLFGLVPLVLMWVANVIDSPAEKRAVAIALVNAVGNCSSIYGVFLWPKSDAPQYVAGFSATTIFVAGIAALAPIVAWRFNKEQGTGPLTRLGIENAMPWGRKAGKEVQIATADV